MINIPTIPLKSNYVYKETATRKLELTFLEPLIKKYDKAPLLFMTTGGGWHFEERQWMIDFVPVIVERLRNEGFAVASADYRITGDGAKMTDILTDCFDAARYMARYADVFGIDKNRIVTIGHSAGGQIALMLAYAPQDKFKDDLSLTATFNVNVAVGLSPVAVIHDRSFHKLNNLADLYDNEYDEIEIGETEPIHNVSKNCPDTILLTGSLDELIFAKSSELLYEKLKKAGVNVKLLYSNGGCHDYKQIDENIIPSPAFEDIQAEIADLIINHIKRG